MYERDPKRHKQVETGRIESTENNTEEPPITEAEGGDTETKAGGKETRTDEEDDENKG